MEKRRIVGARIGLVGVVLVLRAWGVESRVLSLTLEGRLKPAEAWSKLIGLWLLPTLAVVILKLSGKGILYLLSAKKFGPTPPSAKLLR